MPIPRDNNHLSPNIPNSDFGSISKAVPGMGWGGEESSAGDVSRGAQEAGIPSESRKWSVSQVRILQVLAKDPRLAALVSESQDAISCFVENLDTSKEQQNGFLRVLDLDCKRVKSPLLPLPCNMEWID